MELTTHQKTVKYTVYCLVIAVAGLLQNTPRLFWQIGSARCFLLLPVSLSLANASWLYCGRGCRLTVINS